MKLRQSTQTAKIVYSVVIRQIGLDSVFIASIKFTMVFLLSTEDSAFKRVACCSCKPSVARSTFLSYNESLLLSA